MLNDIGLVAENPDQKSREQHGNGPEGGGIQHSTCHAEPDRLTHPLIFLCPVVEAGHRLCSVGQALYRHGAHLPQGVDDGHDTHVQVAAVGLEGGVAHHLHQTVGQIHEETRQAQGNNPLHPAGLQFHAPQTKF